MKKDTITITRAEYEHLNKAANKAVEHALELVQAAWLVDELKARIAELEAKNDNIKDDYYKLYDYALELEDRETHLENLLKHAREDVAELEAGRNEWFTMYQDLKERTDNYDFLLLKTREQEKEIYHLVKEINKLGG
mgnify:CR=1 FL=1